MAPSVLNFPSSFLSSLCILSDIHIRQHLRLLIASIVFLSPFVVCHPENSVSRQCLCLPLHWAGDVKNANLFYSVASSQVEPCITSQGIVSLPVGLSLCISCQSCHYCNFCHLIFPETHVILYSCHSYHFYHFCHASCHSCHLYHCHHFLVSHTCHCGNFLTPVPRVTPVTLSLLSLVALLYLFIPFTPDTPFNSNVSPLNIPSYSFS
jgi:hypothetical protein